VVAHLLALTDEQLVDSVDVSPPTQVVYLDVKGAVRPRDLERLLRQADVQTDQLMADDNSERLVHIDLSRAGRVPHALALLMAATAIGVLAHLVVVGARSRRREIAVLRALGLRPAQVRRATACQSTTIALIAIVVGMPLGVAGGRLVWRAYAKGLGVLPEPATPALLLLVLAGAALLTANVVAAGPGWRESRARPIESLKAE
jgi:predicted lysophospholipase L1 biosynthesis ABC-type transport system permease subunit